MLIREYQPADRAGVWEILRPIFRAGETYAYPRDVGEEEALRRWTGDGHAVFVAADEESGRLLGTYYITANHDGPGDHVCNCGYVVAPEARGRSVGSRMCEHSQVIARNRGFRAMQFNLVASSNRGAVALWERLGFDTVGTLPGAFRHPTEGYVDAFVMFKDLA